MRRRHCRVQIGGLRLRAHSLHKLHLLLIRESSLRSTSKLLHFIFLYLNGTLGEHFVLDASFDSVDPNLRIVLELVHIIQIICKEL